MQALFAAPLCSVHPWRSPNCKTRSGLRLAGQFADSWGRCKVLGRPGSIWSNFRFQWSLLISNKLKLIDGCSSRAHSPPACFARHSPAHLVDLVLSLSNGP